jgi:hypothetical protein
VNPKDVHTLSSELENRLDDLFREDEVPQENSQQTGAMQDYPLAELKSLVLSIDWEITDEVLDKFLKQLNELKLRYQADKIILTFLQILSSLGDYVKTNRSRAHPKTFKILNSVFARLDQLILSKDMSELDKKRILQTEIHRYKELRAQIARSKAAGLQKRKSAAVVTEKVGVMKAKTDAGVLPAEPPPRRPPVAKDALSVADRYQGGSIKALADAVEEIKRYIHAEIKEIKEELQLLRKQK